MVFYERNLKILSSCNPKLAERLTKPEPTPFPDVAVMYGANEQGIIDNIAIKEGNDVPKGDGKAAIAETWVNNINPNAHTIIIYGFGLGYHIEAAIKKYPDKKIIVIEPDIRVFALALNIRDLSYILNKCELLVGETVDVVRMNIFVLLTHPLARGIQFVAYYVEIYKTYSRDLLDAMAQILNDWAVMINTKRSLVEPWLKNRVANIGAASVNAASLKGQFKNVPAILVGAGPSLNSQIDMLKKLNGRAVIVAASTAVQILNSHGIEPTFAIAIDQDPITSGGLHENLDSDIPLVFDGQIAQNSLKYKGKKFQFRLNVNKFTGMVLPELPILESGPSVANVALDFLRFLGCSPILIVGMDLSYTNNTLYAEGTEFNQHDIDGDGRIKVMNNRGELVVTEPSFICMRNWFIDYIRRHKPNDVFNCTESGIVIDGLPNKSLSDFEFKRKYNLKHPVDKAYYKGIFKRHPNYIRSDYQTKINSFIDDLKKMVEIITATPHLTPTISTMPIYTIIDDFANMPIYLEEIYAEDRIKRGEDVETCIKHFQKRKSEILLESIDKVKKILEGD